MDRDLTLSGLTQRGGLMEPWDEEHVKALLRFPRFPMRLIQQDPLQTWISQHGGLKGVYTYLQNYPLSPSHRRILEVVLSNPEAVADVYANSLNMSRATYFYRLRELVPALVQALNNWESEPTPSPASVPEATATGLSNLPTPLTSLVGAEPALQVLVPFLLRQEVRLLTLLGPGGIGKTRFGIELARRLCDRWADGLCFVELAPLTDSLRVSWAIVQALRLKEVSEAQCEAQLKAYLRPKEFLLVLDNFEHLMSAALLVSDLLAAAPRLKILVTSRTALHVYGEYEFTLSPLATPNLETLQDPAQSAQSPAVALFVQRAQAVNPGFTLNPENSEAVAELCRRMEGIPLAIEMVASQSKYFSPQAMLVRLSNSKRLHFLGQKPKDLPPRQQTLRGLLDWSYVLLTPELQTLFSRLAIFAGGCTIEAAATVCASPESDESKEGGKDAPGIPAPVQAGLTALVDQSLLQQQVEPDGEPRFQMLEITREYALEQLNLRGETAHLQKAHAVYYLGLSEQNQPQPAAALQRVGLELMQRESANLKVAIQWTLDHREGELGLRFVVALWNFWKWSGRRHEGRQITQALLEQTAGLRLLVRARVLRLAGWLAYDLRDYTTMLRSFQTSLELSEELEDRRGIGLALHGLGTLAQMPGQWEQAREHLQRGLTLFQALEVPEYIAWTFSHLGRLALSRRDLAKAQDYFQKSVELFRPLNLNVGAAFALGHLGQVLLYQGFLEQATSALEECLALSQTTGDTRGSIVALALNYLGEIAIYRDQPLQARKLINTCLTLSKDEGYTWGIELSSCTLGLLAMREERPLSAAQCFRESLLLQQSLKEFWRSVTLLEMVADLSVACDELLGAARLYGAAERLRLSQDVLPLPIYRQPSEQSQSQLRARLNPAALDEAWAAGQSLSLDQAITYALRCLE